MIIALIISIFVNFLAVIFYIFMGKSFWHEVKKKFTKKMELVHVKNNKLERFLVDDNKDLPTGVGVKDIDISNSYYDTLSNSNVLFNVGNETRAHNFHLTPYGDNVEEIVDKGSNQVVKVGIAYKAGDGASKAMENYMISEIEEAERKGGNSMIAWVMVIVLVIVIIVLVMQILGYMEITEIVKASGGETLFG